MERFRLIRLLVSRYLVETFLQVASAELHRSKQKPGMMAIQNLVAIGFGIKPVISPTYQRLLMP
jgi:hypothetical protein